MNLLATRGGRRFLFAALYLSEGAPIGYIWWTLPAELRDRGVAVETITAMTALLVLPWTFKFVWAPQVDVLRGPRWSLKHWIVSMQLAMGLVLAPLLFFDNLYSNLTWLTGLLVVHALFAATQDAAIDALCIASVEPAERGSVNGWMQAGMLVGRGLLGGGALYLSERLGQRFAIVLLLACIWTPMTLVIFATGRGEGKAKPPPRRAGEFWRSAGEVLRSGVTWIGLLFALTAGAAFEAAGATAGTFLLDRGYAKEAVGQFYLAPALVLPLVGSLLGGFLADRWGKRRTVAAAQSLIVVFVALLALEARRSEPSFPGAAMMLLAGVYFGLGAFTASSYALLMNLTHPRLAATQYSAYMGATNGCESWAAFAVGRMIERSGYGPAYLVMCVVAVASLALLPWMRTSRPRRTVRDD